jgi:hypothetical protein
MMSETVKSLQTTDAAIQTLSDVADRLVLTDFERSRCVARGDGEP